MNYFFKTHKASHIFPGPLFFFLKGEGLHNSFKLRIRENHLWKHMVFRHIMKNLTKIQSADQLISHLYFLQAGHCFILLTKTYAFFVCVMLSYLCVYLYNTHTYVYIHVAAE